MDVRQGLQICVREGGRAGEPVCGRAGEPVYERVRKLTFRSQPKQNCAFLAVGTNDQIIEFTLPLPSEK